MNKRNIFLLAHGIKRGLVFADVVNQRVVFFVHMAFIQLAPDVACVAAPEKFGKITDLKIREDMSRLQERENKAFSDYTESIERQVASTF